MYAISKQDIEQAHERIKPFVHETAVLTSEAINSIAACEIFFKCENFQKIGAFKMRGATNAFLQLTPAEKINGVITHSSGNHAQAVAKAAKETNCKAYIVMPKNAPKVKVAAVEGYGGKITFCEPTLAAREENVEKLIKKNQATFIHPYDNKEVITGQATVAKELVEQVKNLDCLICPVGGGGLLAGTALSSYYFGNQIQVFAGEPEGADDAKRSFESGTLIPQVKPNTIADGLLTSLGKLNFEIIKSGVSDVFTVNDQEIVVAMRLIWERMKIIVEPSCAVPLAAILKNKEIFKNQRVGLLLSGGNVDLEHFFEQLA